MSKLLTHDDFVIWQPGTVELLKSEPGDSEEHRRIGGYCSTEHLDRQNEVVLQRGLDFSEFVQHGYFNDNHNQATAAVVGIPDAAEFHSGKGWYTTGHFLKGFQRADDIWNLAKSLEDTKRRLGFSIEGKVLERRNNHIVKAKIRNVAVTNCPVNPNCTWEVLAKSFDSDEVMERALTAGSARTPTSGGRVLVPQDLEQDEVTAVWPCKHKGCKKAFHSEKGYALHMEVAHGAPTAKSFRTIEKLLRKSQALTEGDAVALLRQLRPHYSEGVCKRIFHLAVKGA
jgi:hypothetical protein